MAETLAELRSLGDRTLFARMVQALGSIAQALAGALSVTGASDPATTAAAVTPSDSTALTSRGVWVGGAGNLAVKLSGAPSTAVTFTAVPAGTLLPISVVRVMATGTTATNINVLN